MIVYGSSDNVLINAKETQIIVLVPSDDVLVVYGRQQQHPAPVAVASGKESSSGAARG